MKVIIAENTFFKFKFTEANLKVTEEAVQEINKKNLMLDTVNQKFEKQYQILQEYQKRIQIPLNNLKKNSTVISPLGRFVLLLFYSLTIIPENIIIIIITIIIILIIVWYVFKSIFILLL
jgi:hypothetical protein